MLSLLYILKLDSCDLDTGGLRPQAVVAARLLIPRPARAGTHAGAAAVHVDSVLKGRPKLLTEPTVDDEVDRGLEGQ